MKLFQIYYKIIFLFFLFIFINSYVFADDLLPIEDDFDISEIISEESIETNSNSLQVPTINSRAYVAYYKF